MNERIMKLRDYVEYNCEHYVYRSQFFALAAASLRETLGEPRMTRRAKAFANLMDNVDLVVHPYELLGGSIAGIYPKVDVPPPAERRAGAREAIERYIATRRPGDEKRMRRTMFSRIHYHGSILYDDLQQLIREFAEEYRDDPRITRPEIAKQLEEYFIWDFGEDERLVGELPWEATNHNDLNPPKIVSRGIGDIRREAAESLENCQPEQKEFYECAVTAADAFIRFIQRYAAVFAAAAAAETDSVRKAELERIAAGMAKVATEKPGTFFEALQLFWLVYTVSQMQACAGSCASYARFDQYMYPFYRRDIDAGILTEEEALDLICNMYIKTTEPKMRLSISICLGGQTPDGKDAANDLTKLCLKAVQILRQPFPNVAVRFFDDSPEWLWDMAVDTLRYGSGNPQLLNDNVWVTNFVRGGVALEDARDYYNMGCVEMLIMGKVARWNNVIDINFPNILQRVLDNGGTDDMAISKLSASGGSEKIYTGTDGMTNTPFPPPTSIRTGELEELDSFDKFMEAYRLQLCHQLADLKIRSDIADRIQDEYWCDPFGSLFQDCCLERGKDIYQGGAKYDAWKVASGLGLGTAVDSLMAIKKFVYEDKKYTLTGLKKMLDDNFEGSEEARQFLANNTPAFGNDIEEADQLATSIFGWYADAVEDANRQGIRGYAVTSSFSYTSQVTIGEATGAMPNGRRRGEIISDSIGPTQGKDMGGPTRMLKSITALNPDHLTGATSVNLKLSPSVIKGQQGINIMKALFKGYLANGGSQLQVNLVDSSTMRAAQAEPDKYKSLVVRVAGYCEYFNNLDEQLQNEVIARTDHGVA